jgi:hypothetical protein
MGTAKIDGQSPMAHLELLQTPPAQGSSAEVERHLFYKAQPSPDAAAAPHVPRPRA